MDNMTAESFKEISGMIFDIKRFAIHDGPGIRTTVFFKGCPLDCRWCHNPEGKKPGEEKITVKRRRNGRSGGPGEREEIFGREVSVGEVTAEIEKDIIFYEQSGGGATFSGGEPMMQIDFLYELLKECKTENIDTALDTCGHAEFENFERIHHLVDLFLYDIKIIDDNAHRKYTGESNRHILANLKRLAEMGKKIELRIPLIPGITDTRENIEAIRDFLKSLPGIEKVSLLPYNKLVEDKLDKFNLDNTYGKFRTQSRSDLKTIGDYFRSAGYEIAIGG